MRITVFALVPLSLLVLACASPDEGERLSDLFEREWAFRLAENPLYATSVGVHDYDHLLPAMTPADLERRAEVRRSFLAELDRIETSQLSRQERISYDMLKRELELDVAGFELGEHEMSLTVDDGFHIAFARLPKQQPLRNASDYESYIARLLAYPEYVDQQVALLRSGLERGLTLPRAVLEGYEVTIASHVVEDPTRSLFWEPFESFPETVAESDRRALRAAGREAIVDGVVEGYRRFLTFMTEEYVPGARASVGASELPSGREYYELQIARYTTLDDLTPEEIHEIGLREVERIYAEMQQILDEVGFEGDFAEFLAFLRTDPRFYARTPEELLKEAAYLAKRIDGRLPRLFGRLPRLPYGIEPVPDHLAPKYTGGRYVPPAAGSTQPGIYWVNTYALENRPLYVLPALTLHEAVPGHHLQGALARELDGLPTFRRFTYLSAFGEGWGLYAEWLGLELGMYPDPYSRFGRLTYEMWRACRLVVDTGLHALGWSREQALEYLGSRTALSLHEVRTETDRYISWPGQALAYKLGELTLRRLRQEAREALGEAFDVREFHDVVLRDGAVPLPVLERQVTDWVETRRGDAM